MTSAMSRSSRRQRGWATVAKLPSVGPDPYDYANHSGVDFLRGPSWLGKAFYASGPGRVVRLSKNAAGGCWIVVKYDAIPYEVGYAHMRSHNGCPRPGTRVNLGTRLGYVGDLGARVTGPHVHKEIIGRATSAAVWEYFDRNRWAGGGSTAGTGGSMSATQRQVVVAGANGRKSPSTKAAKTQFLDPGTIGNFDGWIRGESVEGNNIWFRGEYSGDWFWSGGFTSK